MHPAPEGTAITPSVRSAGTIATAIHVAVRCGRSETKVSVIDAPKNHDAGDEQGAVAKIQPPHASRRHLPRLRLVHVVHAPGADNSDCGSRDATRQQKQGHIGLKPRHICHRGKPGTEPDAWLQEGHDVPPV